MKRMGRKHRHFFRICATNSRSPRDGRVIEELGTYDPMIADTHARVTLNDERIKYWLGVGALPSDKVKILIKKYGEGGTHANEQKAAKDRLAGPRGLPDAGEPKWTVDTPSKKKGGEEAPAEAAAEPAAEAAPA
jgi:small subunit ribosomal protein S16